MADVDALKDVMGPQLSPGDLGVAALAARQHGVVAHRQLVAEGLGPRGIGHRVAAGRLHRIHRGVYAVGHPVVSGRGRWMAAVLATGPHALLSHQSAGALWDLLPTGRAAIDVLAARGRHDRPGIAVHQARRLHPDDRAVVDGIPTTAPPRTLFDLAEVLPAGQLERAVEQAERLRLLDMRALQELCARSRGRRGLAVLSSVFDAYREGPPPTRSELECRFLDLCREARLPAPAVNVLVAGLEVDAAWPDRKLVVELDGHAFHATRAAFERDRKRDAALLVSGFRVLRVTHRRLEKEPATVIETVRTLLAAGA